MDKGKFFVLEGIDGVGKSTQIELLKSTLRGRFYFTREPGGTPNGENITGMLKGEKNAIVKFYLYQASRAMLAPRIKAFLEKGYNVICDRWTPSTQVYQSIKGIPDLAIEICNELSCQNITPDRIYLLDLDPTETLNRIQSRKPDGWTMPANANSLLTKARKKYLSLAEGNPVYMVIDASLDTTIINDIVTKDIYSVAGG